jgi:glyoxylase-like metal-dependent hydrolase (beta-lactamase superfamily II)
VIFRQFRTRDEDIGYLLADPVTRHAALLDPHIDAEQECMEVIRQLDLRLVRLIETHLHESHLSAAPLLRADTGARLVAHRCVDVPCVDLRVDHGETIFVGEEVIRVLATPGHSACSLSYLWRDRVFTGHALLAGDTGPCRRRDADAGQLFDSVSQRLFALPDETLVFPGRVLGEQCSSSIARERQLNARSPAWLSREAFIQHKQREAARGWDEHRLAANCGCEIRI